MAYTRDSSAQTHLTPNEAQLVETIESGVNDAISFLERIVNMNSGSMNFDGVRQVGAAFAEELEPLGFKTWWVDGEAFSRAGHLFATRGNSGPHFLMIGHLDTVFELDSEFQTFTRLNENQAEGPGVIDMKGGDVVMLEVVRALHAVGTLDNMTVTIALIGDEESSGDPLEVGRASLVEAAKKADIALAFEPGDGDPQTAVLARRGFTGWEVHASGVRGHSSAVFSDELGYGSIYEAARILTGFQQQLTGQELLTFNPGLILGGTSVEFDEENDRGSAVGKTNVISEKTIVTGDLRTISPQIREEVKAKMRAIVDDHLPGTDAEILFRDSYPPMGMTEGNERLLAMLSKASTDAGYDPVRAGDPADAGAADISFAAGLVSMALDGLGMTGDGTHTTKEWADLSTLPMQTIRSALLMQRIADSWNK
jgi:glutamate carboxypeptidase